MTKKFDLLNLLHHELTFVNSSFFSIKPMMMMTINVTLVWSTTLVDQILFQL